MLTPFHAPKALWFSLFGLGKALAYVSKPLHAWWYEYTRLGLLKRVLAARVSRQTASVIYAQDPVSAEAALSLKAQGYPVEVVSAVHFNLFNRRRMGRQGGIWGPRVSSTGGC